MTPLPFKDKEHLSDKSGYMVDQSDDKHNVVLLPFFLFLLHILLANIKYKPNYVYTDEVEMVA